MEEQARHSPFSVMLITFIVAVSLAIGYYQLFYLPYINQKPTVPAEYLNPPKVTKITILPNSYDPSSKDNFVPKRVVVQLGVDNKVVWVNEDVIGHTVTSDNDYKDPVSGPFDSLKYKDTNPVIQPGKEFSFVFTQIGEYKYHCTPHPWMTGTVIVERAKF